MNKKDFKTKKVTCSLGKAQKPKPSRRGFEKISPPNGGMGGKKEVKPDYLFIAARLFLFKLQINPATPININGILSNCPILSFIVVSNAT